MRFFEPMVMEGYEWLNCVSPADYELFASFDGKARATGWIPVSVRCVRADQRSEQLESDFPWLGAHVLVMRRQAVSALGDLLDAEGELLRLETDRGVELFAFNAQVRDALDESRSSISRFPSSGRIMRIRSAVLRADALIDADIFRLPHRGGPTYVSQRFVDRVTAGQLRGLRFTDVTVV